MELQILCHLLPRFLNDFFLYKHATQLKVLATNKNRDLRDLLVTNFVLIVSKVLSEVHIEGLLDVGCERHAQGLATSHQSQGAGKVLHDQIGRVDNLSVVLIVGEIFQNQLSCRYKGDGH